MASIGVRLGFSAVLRADAPKRARLGCNLYRYTQTEMQRTLQGGCLPVFRPPCRCHHFDKAARSRSWTVWQTAFRGQRHVDAKLVQRNVGDLHPSVAATSGSIRAVDHFETGHDDERDSRSKGSDNTRFYPMLAILFSSLFTPKADDDMEDEVTLLIKMARLAHIKGELKEADEHYHRALAAVVQRGKDKVWESHRVVEARVYIYDAMANLALSAVQLTKAESLFKETLRGLFQLGRKQTDNAIVEVSLKLAMIYGMMNRDKEAETGYQFCIDVMEKKRDELLPSADLFEEDSKEETENILALLGMCLNSYARFLLNQHRLKPAEEILQKAIEVAELVYDENDNNQVAVLYNDLATVQSSLGQDENALGSVKKAISIGEKLKSTDLATYICNSGAINAMIGEYEEAVQTCTKAMRMAQKNGDKETVEEARRCLTLVRIYKDKAKQKMP